MHRSLLLVHRVIIALIRVIANTFFRRIDVVGIENVPEEGPVIFAGNHPNALMDGFLLIAKCRRWPIYFMANAKLWEYKLLALVLNTIGAVPVYRREEHDGEVDNQKAFEKLYEVIESGNCMGIFPEGISHAESQLVKLKTGTARIALSVSARGGANVRIVPCGLNYIHRHRFRSQVLIEFGTPIVVDAQWIEDYRQDEQATVRGLTERLSQALINVTLNAPDWRTLRFIQTARRLYKPASADLAPGEYIELSRRFVDSYLRSTDDAELQAFRDEVENYQARLDMLGLKDHQLRKPITMGYAFRKVLLRSVTMLALLPLAIPGALLHLPIGWLAATVGERFSYEMDDIATLKVFSTILLLPILYVGIAILVGMNFGFCWAFIALLALSFSFFASVRVIEAEAGLLISMLSILKLTRLGSEVDDLRELRTSLVHKIRILAERLADPNLPRIFTSQDFDRSDNQS